MSDQPARVPLHREHTEEFGPVAVRPLDLRTDLDTLHAWVSEERAAFWGMVGLTRGQVAEIYAHMETLDTHHAFVVEREGTGALLALFQTYEPDADRVGECYEVRPGDIGLHVLLAPPGEEGPRRGWSGRVLRVITGCLLRERTRVVVDPDVRNDKAIARFVREGFVLGDRVTLPEVRLPDVFLPEKQARLAFLTRG
jgi:hypothetical protein